MTWSIQRLAAAHDRSRFTCGHPQLDDYIRLYASQHARKRVGRTFVALHPNSKRLLGYYTLSSSTVTFSEAPEAIQRKLPRYPIPVALLGKLAVDQSAQGQGLGEFLLVDALRRVAGIAEELAIYAVEVHAIDKQASCFYERYGFQPLQDQPRHLFLPLAAIESLF